MSIVPFEFLFLTPYTPSCQTCYLLDKVFFRTALKYPEESKCSSQDFIVELWTDVFHKENNEGEWHKVPMTFQSSEKLVDAHQVVSYYGVDLLVTCLGKYKFTYRAKHRKDNDYQWAAWFNVNGCLEVRRQTNHLTTFIQVPEVSQVTHNIYIGNFTAAQEAHLNGFDGLLNVSDEAQVYAKQLSRPIILKKLPIAFGANVVISETHLLEAVFWLRAMSDLCNKIMVASRDGHGRAGSILIAFIFAMNPNLSFEEAYRFVNDRHFVYPHRGLRSALERLYVRE
ncbi:Dual specificity phosphatase catalytic domain protein [Biomphalaria pfeifferi]|uniref:Dual specificity phosphatase catalytic domain protein n=1 Tax=Biomphalaria pfeifferi TaxID=112525 RepID=A0AAD8EV78_BIOPF|nr:Dual specificity phosphatase catalytic domain protein [Biomphalaria pfeifferi]